MSEASWRPAFIKNQGQQPKAVLYLTDGPGDRIFLTADAVIWAYRVPPDDVWAIALRLPGGAELQPVERARNVISLVRRPELQPWGHRLERWRAVRYASVWPGVDLTFRIGTGVDWLFDLAPGADLGAVVLDWEGAGLVHLDDEGDMVLREGDVQLFHPRPQAFQDGEPVPVCYQLVGPKRVGFWLGSYDPLLPVQIRVVH